jgi:hypothetical protein
MSTGLYVNTRSVCDRDQLYPSMSDHAFREELKLKPTPLIVVNNTSNTVSGSHFIRQAYYNVVIMYIPVITVIVNMNAY